MVGGGGGRGCKFDIQKLHEAEKMNLQIMQSRCNIDAEIMQQIIVAY